MYNKWLKVLIDEAHDECSVFDELFLFGFIPMMHVSVLDIGPGHHPRGETNPNMSSFRYTYRARRSFRPFSEFRNIPPGCILRRKSLLHVLYDCKSITASDNRLPIS